MISLQKLTPISLSVLLALGVSPVQAGGTDAGTEVTNTATISYAVGGVQQSDITSASTDFLVDRKIDLTVDGDSDSNLIVAPSSTGGTNSVNQLVYTVTNTGNDTQDFNIDVSHVAGEGAADEGFDAASCHFFLGTVTTTTYALGTTAKIDDLAKDDSETVTIYCDIQDRPTRDDGDLSTLDVLATAVAEDGSALTETTGADDASTVDIVFADDTGTATDGADHNAKHSDTQTYEVDVPMLTVSKTSAVISDPFNGETNPKRIPGAIVEYTISIENQTDAADASNVTMTDVVDEIDSSLSFVANSIAVSGEPTPDPTTTNTQITGTSSNTVEATGLDIDAGETVTITFEVKVQ